MLEKIKKKIKRVVLNTTKENAYKKIEKKLSPQQKGQIGEYKIKTTLEMNLPESEYLILKDVLLSLEPERMDQGFSQIDLIVVSVYGVFVIENKNYRGVILGKEKENKWTQSFSKKNYPFYNPILQNQKHIKTLLSYIENETDDMKDKIFSIITFSADANLKYSHTQTPVLHYDHLIEHLQTYSKKVISASSMWFIYEKIKSNNKDSPVNRRKHIDFIKNGTYKKQI